MSEAQVQQQQQQTPQHRPSSNNRSTSSIAEKPNNGEAATGDYNPRHHKPKQFIVSRHPRVPSFGRGLNKLGNKHTGGVVATSPKTGATRTRKGGAAFELGSPTGSVTDDGSYKDEGEYQPQPPPIARTGSNNRIARTDSNNNIARNTSLIGLTKSSSTRSLDRESRKHHATRRGTTTDKAAERVRSKSGDRRRQTELNIQRQQQRRAQSSDALTEMMARAGPPPPATRRVAAIARERGPPNRAQPQQQQQQQQPQPQSSQFHHPVQSPHSPQQFDEPVIVPGTDIHAPIFHPPITPAHSLPSSQEPLTSRFIRTSPSSGADSAPNKRSSETTTNSNATPLTRSESAYSISSSAATAPSRTQQKLWLQRASAEAEFPHRHSTTGSAVPAAVLLHPAHARDWYLIQTARAEKECDRVAREYLNVRRFKNPLGEAIERVRSLQVQRGIEVVKPSQKKRPTTAAGSADVVGSMSAAGMGLSRSLQEGEGGVRRNGRDSRGIRLGSRDDSGVVESSSSRGEVNVDLILERMWRREMLVSNE